MKKIRQRDALTYVLGLGYIGLPTVLYYASKGLVVHGIDTNEDLVKDLKDGTINMKEEGLVELAATHLSRIHLEISYDSVGEADVCVLCLPSPINDNKEPVTECLEESVAVLGRKLEKECIILVESTVPVGTTDRLSELFGRVSGLRLDKDFWFAHCPERVLPGNVVAELESNHRIVGGVTEQSMELATAFLSMVFNPDLVHPTSARVSEAVKLAENVFRDVNVAFANELAKICTVLRIDVNEVIRLSNLHPRVDILRPGIGVGGYCIPKDGWLLVESVKDDLMHPDLIPAARRVNDSMPKHVFERIQQIKTENQLLGSVIGLLGLSFKPNVSDTRNSPSVDLIQLLVSAGLDVIVYDPYVNGEYNCRQANNLKELLDLCEVVVLGVGHAQLIQELNSSDLSGKILVDPSNAVPELKTRVKKYLGLSG